MGPLGTQGHDLRPGGFEGGMLKGDQPSKGRSLSPRCGSLVSTFSSPSYCPASGYLLQS